MGVFGQIGKRWVRTHPDFDADARAAGAQHRRFQDALSGLRQRIALDPEAGTDSGRGDGSRIAKSVPYPQFGVPGIAILYTFDAENVYLLKLRAFL